MGWYGYTRKDREYVEDYFKRNGYDILECAVVNDVFYAAVRCNAGNDYDGRVLCLVALLHGIEHAGDGHYFTKPNFEYKPMGETVGPYYYDCPKKVFDLLSPLRPNETMAIEWRRKVKAKLDAAEAA